MKHKSLYLAGGIAILLIALFWLGGRNAAPHPAVNDPNALPGIQTGNAPWQPEVTYLKERLADIGLPALATEGTALHIHQHLDIFIHGNAVPVPQDVGIDDAAGFIAPIHVHDATGIIHVESPVVQNFTLGQFFDIWGVRLTDQCIGGYCNSATSTIKMFVNGAPYTGNPRDLVLESHQEIAITYGTDGELPKQIPSSYSFPAGY